MELYVAPLLVKRKWHLARRNLPPGDVVIMQDNKNTLDKKDNNKLRGNYSLVLVKEVFPGKDGKKGSKDVNPEAYSTNHIYHRQMRL